MALPEILTVALSDVGAATGLQVLGHHKAGGFPKPLGGSKTWSRFWCPSSTPQEYWSPPKLGLRLFGSSQGLGPVA